MEDLTDLEILAWDKWFANGKDDQSIREWNAAKDVKRSDDKFNLRRWAVLIEFNRLDRIQKENPPSQFG